MTQLRSIDDSTKVIERKLIPDISNSKTISIFECFLINCTNETIENF